MSSFFSSGYGVILLVWGLAFEVIGAAAMVLLGRAFGREDRAEHLAETAPPEANARAEEQRELVGSGRH